MPSATETAAPAKTPAARPIVAGMARWNRRLHFYAGLFLLFFVWLFALSGLILNHPTWSFAESWNNRHETNYVREITAPGPEAKGDVGQAREIMRKLGIVGEILWAVPRKSPDELEFQVRRPGHFYFIKADLAKKSVAVRQDEVNLWGVIKVLHTFTGSYTDARHPKRDWALTWVWVVSMDAVAAGLIFMVLSSLYMWWELRPKRFWGAIALGLGCASCGLFCAGLRWIF
jgi:hypothetical protein